MFQVSDEQFDELMHQAIDSLPKEHIDHLKNVAILFEDDPDEEQREKVHYKTIKRYLASTRGFRCRSGKVCKRRCQIKSRYSNIR